MNQAQLITPEGKTIVLPDNIYFRALELLELERANQPLPKKELEQLIKETRGSLKDAGKKPLTQVLLESRREEFEREERRIRTRTKRLASRTKRAA